MSDRGHLEIFLDKGWSTMFIVCEHTHECTNITCYYIRPVSAQHPILGARCDRANGNVNITETDVLDENDPNYRFKMRKKDGL